MTQTRVGTPLIAIVGNPNAGKTSLFNALTGSHQKVANYPGITVERVTGMVSLFGRTVEYADIPGLYSLKPVSEDEIVAVKAIRGEFEGQKRPQLLVVVMDAGNLERNLFLYSQLADEGFPMLIALTMTDLAKRDGIEIDVAALSERLGIEVVPVVSHKGKGLKTLQAAIARNLNQMATPKPVRRGAANRTGIAFLRERMARAGYDYPDETLRQILDGTYEDWDAIAEAAPELHEAVMQAREHRAESEPAMALQDRYAWSAEVSSAVSRRTEESAQKKTITDRIDLVLTHRFWGLTVFLGVMYLVFQSIYTFATPIMDLINDGFGKLQGWMSPWFGSNETLRSLVVDGIVGGVGAVLVFLPQILILFLFITCLEGTGYLARAAFLMDRLLGWCGLSGRAFIPLLASFACAIPGIMAARVMPDQRSRLATILVAPLMSCSARLPVYLLMIGVVIEPKYGALWAGFTLFAMHLLGLFVAIPVIWVINRKLLKARRLPFLLELPRYQLPKWKDVLLALYSRGMSFLQTAGTIIVLLSVAIWALTYFPRSEHADKQYQAEYQALANRSPESADPQTQAVLARSEEDYVLTKRAENSFLGRFGKTVEPIFAPAGFDWRLSTAILAAFPAREVVVPSMGIMFSLGNEQDENSDDLRVALSNATWPDGRPLVTPWTAASLMVFFALCCQCIGTLATIKRETGSWKWPAFVFTYMTTLAYVLAVGIQWVGRLVGGA